VRPLTSVSSILRSILTVCRQTAAPEPVQLGDNDRLHLPPLNHGLHALHARPVEGFGRFPALLESLGAVYRGHGANLLGLRRQ